MPSIQELKEWVGVACLDVPRYLWSLRRGAHEWTSICNRIESVSHNPDGPGVSCEWQWSSELHAPKVLPSLGRLLFRRCMEDYPIDFSAGTSTPAEFSAPAVTIIIGHRGKERLPHLLKTLSSIALQDGVPFECIVVEQSEVPEIKEYLPGWVRYLHDRLTDSPYNRSRAFNVGVRHARGELVVLHDNDMLVPACYAERLLYHRRQGFDFINLKRFIFYFSEETTTSLLHDAPDQAASLELDAIVQNAVAGGSVALSRKAYDEIGGMDEGFVGWGGEDVDLWERAQTLRVWNYAYLPIVHVWHSRQPEKNVVKDTPAMRRLRDRSRMHPSERIAELRRSNHFPFNVE